MTFHVGQKVVCVDDSMDERFVLFRMYPVRGNIYTIRDLPFITAVNTVGVLLEELRNPVASWLNAEDSEPSFRLDRFRPVTERETSIEFAHEILRSASQKVEA
jgi:hypothetical protein